MDLLLMTEEEVVDSIQDHWTGIGTERMVSKRKHWTQENNSNKMRKINGQDTSWDNVDELGVDLDGSCSLAGFNIDLGSSTFSNSEALLALPSLSSFKQEFLTPFNGSDGNIANGGQGTPERQKQIEPGRNIAEKENGVNSLHTQSDDCHSGANLRNPLVTSAPATSSTVSPSAEDCRFQYVLAAATSIATKVSEETLTYLNQGQPYEIKLKKLGDLSEYRGKILRSVVRLSFHERRLQYMEREQMALWVSSHPGDSILEVDLPLSYGIFDVVEESASLNSVEFLWDPTKEVGVYVKVNCISTEFTPRKHGGEKGVPFRIQVETYLHGDTNMRRLHTASCQVKVFKLKGADRKHKQDKEKILKRPIAEQEKYQCSYDCTVLTDVPVSNENGFVPFVPRAPSPALLPEAKTFRHHQAVSSSIAPKEENLSHPHESPPNSPLQKPTINNEDGIASACDPVNPSWSPQQLSNWLQANRYGPYIHTLSTYSGSDVLRLSKDNLIQLCGPPDGIRLFNALHARPVIPKLTLYVCVEPRERVYKAVYMTSLSSSELISKVSIAIGLHTSQVSAMYVVGPNGIKLVLTDQLIAHMRDHAAYSITSVLEGNDRYQVLLQPSDPSSIN